MKRSNEGEWEDRMKDEWKVVGRRWDERTIEEVFIGREIPGPFYHQSVIRSTCDSFT
jgi:hypothetical protein